MVAPDLAVLVEAAETRLRAETADIPPSMRDGLMVSIGRPCSVICAAASAYEADLVIVGAHEYGAFSRVLGTTASRVVNRIDRPVLVVRRAPRATARPVVAAASLNEHDAGSCPRGGCAVRAPSE